MGIVRVEDAIKFMENLEVQSLRDMAIKILILSILDTEKQTPKKPNVEGDGESDGQYGWTPCYVRMPLAEDLHQKSIENCTSYLVERKCGVMEVAKYIKVYGEPHFDAYTIELKDVVAWRPLPEPYKPFTVE